MRLSFCRFYLRTASQLFERASYRLDQRRHANLQREVRGRFKGVRKPRFVSEQEKRLGPLRTRARIHTRPNDSLLRRPAFDEFRMIDWANFRHPFHNGFSE